MDFNISIALHIIGIVMWVGGLLILSRFLKVFTESGSGREPFITLMNRVYVGYAILGFAIALVSGFYQLISRGMAYYFSQGWFHTKLTFVIVMIVITGIIAIDLRKIASGELLTKRHVGTIHGIIGLVLLVAVFVTIIGRVG